MLIIFLLRGYEAIDDRGESKNNFVFRHKQNFNQSRKFYKLRQMEDFKSQIDLFLTEISIELLGNKIYDLNGKRQDKIINLFKALPESREETNKHENSNDFVCSLGYNSNFTENDTTVKEFLKDQLDFILKDANTSVKVNQDIIKYLRKYKNEQQTLTEDVSYVNLRKEAGKF